MIDERLSESQDGSREPSDKDGDDAEQAARASRPEVGQSKRHGAKVALAVSLAL
jgi:hypothetical protein